MSLDIAPAGGESAPAPAPSVNPADTSPLSPRDAGAALARSRWEREKQAPEAVEPPPNIPQGIEAAPETDPGELPTETQHDPADDMPPIEPPRSWTREWKEEFKSYPRELQEKIATREQDRERSFRQSQNEAAELRRVAETERVKAEAARTQYESQLPQLHQILVEAQAGAFPDIKSMADVQRLSTEDPLRYLQYTAHQQKVAAVQQEMYAAQERQTREHQSRWQEFASKQDAAVLERIPDLSDPSKRTKVQESARAYLKDVGFQDTELEQSWGGQLGISFRDARVQEMIHDAVKWREAQAKVKTAISSKPLPPVQKPGVSAAKGSADVQHIQTLSAKLDKTGNAKDAAALIAARRAARR